MAPRGARVRGRGSAARHLKHNMSGVKTAYNLACEQLAATPRRWLVTGAAGFIGSHLLERLLTLGQEVVALDDLSTGHRGNIDDAVAASGAPADRCHFLERSVVDADAVVEACRDIDIVLHQAALGSVPRSVKEPLATYACNVEGFINVLDAARDAGVSRLIYASSSSVYGDSAYLPKVEARIGNPASPYAATKRVNELYAEMYRRSYNVEVVGLRYFNVFGKRQAPDGPYAAVIPRWTRRMLAGETCRIFGDGKTTRDYCYIDNVVQANLLAATTEPEAALGVYNVAAGNPTSLNELFDLIRSKLAERRPEVKSAEPAYESFRAGDVRHSYADVSKARERLGYEPGWTLLEGLQSTLDWYAAL